MENKKFLKLMKDGLTSNSSATLTTEGATPEQVKVIKGDVGVVMDTMASKTAGQDEDLGLTPEERLTVENSIMAASSTNVDKLVADFLPEKLKQNLTTESANGAALNERTVINKIFNAAPTKQDAFGEGFFPTIIVDPKETAIKIKINVPSYFTTWGKDGKVKTSMIELARDTSFLLGEENRLIPIFAADVDAFDADNKFDDLETGIATAPIKFGSTVDLSALANDSAVISGGMDTVTGLAPNLSLDKLYFKNAAGSVNLKLSVGSLRSARVTPTSEGKDEDYQINFEANELAISTKDLKKADATQVLTGAEYKIVLSVSARVSGNLETSSMQSFAAGVTVVRVLDGDEVLAAGAELTAITEALAGLELYSFFPKAYIENGDLASEGKIFTMDNDSESYPVPYLAPHSVKGAIAKLYADTDVDLLAGMVSNVGHLASAHAVQKLLDIAEQSKVAYANGNGGNLSGLGNRLIKPFYASIDLDLETAVSNRESSDLEGSIKAIVISNIKNVALKAMRESGLAAANDIVNPGKKLRVTVGVDSTLVDYLVEGDTDIIKISKKLEIQIVSTNDAKMDSKVIGGFTPSADRNTADPLTVGFMGWSPALIVNTTRSIGNKTTECVSAYPKFKHHNLTNVIFEINIINLDKIINKK